MTDERNEPKPRDAGRTELESGTLTAGTDWAPADVMSGAPVTVETTCKVTDRVSDASGLAAAPGIESRPDVSLPSNNVDTSDLPLPVVLSMAEFVAEHPTMMAPAVISQTIRDLIARLQS